MPDKTRSTKKPARRLRKGQRNSLKWYYTNREWFGILTSYVRVDPDYSLLNKEYDALEDKHSERGKILLTIMRKISHEIEDALIEDGSLPSTPLCTSCAELEAKQNQQK